MRSNSSLIYGGLILSLSLAVPLAAQVETSAVIQYTAERLPLGFIPFAMNNRGWIVGHSASTLLPMRYRPGVGTEQISVLRGNLLDINDAGTAAGFLFLDGRVSQAIIRPAGAPWKRIGTLGSDYSSARAINEAGQVVGLSRTASGQERPFIYSEAEGMKMMVDRYAVPASINAAGQVAGSAGNNRGFLWDPVEGFIDITDRVGLDGQFTGGYIAGNGTVAGTYRKRIYNTRVATFSLANGLRLVGERYESAVIQAANSRGWAVGFASSSGDTVWAALYVYGQGVRDINSLLTTPLDSPLTDAIDINDRDEILAYTWNPTHYYILKRVRE